MILPYQQTIRPHRHSTKKVHRKTSKLPSKIVQKAMVEKQLDLDGATHSNNLPTSCKFEKGPNITDGNDLQWSKQDLHTTSTDTEIWIILKPHHLNAHSSIRCSFEFHSDVMDVRGSQVQKQVGMTIHINDDIHAR
jgi:hypothetical protein